MLRLRLRGIAWRILGLAALALLSVALGRDVAALGGDELKVGAVLAAVVAALGVVLMVAIGPAVCVAAIGGLAAAGFMPVLMTAGGVDVTLADVFYVGAVAGWALGQLKATAPSMRRPRAESPFPQAPALIFLAFAGGTLLHVQAVDPGQLDDSLVSWLRLVQTASLAWLAASVIDTKRELTLLLGAIATGGAVAVVLTIEQAISGGGNPFVDRYSAMLNANALGLVSGLLLVFAAFGGVSRRSRPRLALALAGVLGLLLAKSVGAFVATALALAVGMTFRGQATQLQRASRAALALVVAGLIVFGLVQFLRPTSTPTGSGFRESSASQRIILGAAGLEVFERNPVIGAGWRRSDAPHVVADPEIAAELRARFPGAKNEFFPDVSPASVHNTYVQILADLGLIGLALFAAALVSIAAGAVAVLRRVGMGEVGDQAWCAAVGLVLILLWLNDNPIYGGQTETIALALLVGVLAAVGR